MKYTDAPQLPTVAKPRACGALGLMIAGAFGFTASGSTTATNLSARRLGMRTT